MDAVFLIDRKIWFLNIYVKPMENVNKYPYPQIWIKRGVEMQSMKINIITMETTLLKTNCLQYMSAMILAQIFWKVNIEIIYFDINISTRYTCWQILSTNHLNTETRTTPPPPSAEFPGRRRSQKF